MFPCSNRGLVPLPLAGTEERRKRCRDAGVPCDAADEELSAAEQPEPGERPS
eukprot:SAG31_NODE_36884_length_309_cov_0.976190_1_plen_51_part_01